MKCRVVCLQNLSKLRHFTLDLLHHTVEMLDRWYNFVIQCLVVLIKGKPGQLGFDLSYFTIVAFVLQVILECGYIGVVGDQQRI